MTKSSFEIIGSYPVLERVSSGLWSFDRAIGNPYTSETGIILRTVIELYGPPESGKSTLAYYLISQVNPTGTILLASLEITDLNYIKTIMERASYAGTVELCEFHDDAGKWKGHSKMLTDAVNRLGKDEDVSALVLDSIAAIVPPIRETNQIGEGYMMDRAKFMNDMCARAESKLMNRKTPALFLALNHSHQSVDPWKKGHITPGGEGIKYHGAVRIYMARRETFADKKTGLLKGFLAKGSVEKLRFGGRGRKFVVYIVPGRGVHVGMTALFDAVNLGIAKRTKTGHIKLNDEGAGRIGTYVNAAYKGNDKKFQPFIDALATYKEELQEEDDDDTESDTEESD